jgi:hypothetical protein
MKSVNCRKCGKLLIKTDGRYNEAIKNGWNFFCSRSCWYGHQEKGIAFPCAQCQKLIRKTPAQIRQTKRNVFCSKSCAAVYNNKHKHRGIRRSKLEVFLEERLRQEFPRIELQCNARDVIDMELDLYFPELRLAIELNGIFHYKPIYGEEKLRRIQEIDKQKLGRCMKAGVKLFVVDISRVVHLTQAAREECWEFVKELVTSFQRRAGHTNVQVSSFVALGTGRFELPTFRTPSERATRLRHAPLSCL